MAERCECSRFIYCKILSLFSKCISQQNKRQKKTKFFSLPQQYWSLQETLYLFFQIYHSYMPANNTIFSEGVKLPRLEWVVIVSGMILLARCEVLLFCGFQLFLQHSSLPAELLPLQTKPWKTCENLGIYF